MTCGHHMQTVQPHRWPLGPWPCLPCCPGPYLDARAAALAHRVRDGCPGRVDHGHEAHEAEVVGGEVHIVTVEGKALRELLLGQVVMAETWRRERGTGAPASVLPASCPQLPVPAVRLPSWPDSQSTPISDRRLPVSFIHSFMVHSGRPYSEPGSGQPHIPPYPQGAPRAGPAPAPTWLHPWCAPSTRSPRPPSSR